MSLTTTGKNNCLAALGATHVSAHTGTPGDSGANEVTGGTYARQPITFSAPSAGNLDSSSQPTIDIPAGTTVTDLAFWDALTAGNCVATAKPKASYTAAAGQNAGAATLVVVEAINASTPATGNIIVDGDLYAYSSWTGSTFTLNGQVLKRTYATSAPVTGYVTETFGSAGTYQVTDADISIT